MNKIGAGKVSADEEARIAAMLREGCSVIAVSRVTGRNPSTVSRIRDEHGIRAYQPGRPTTAVLSEAAAAAEDEADDGPGTAPLAAVLYAERPHQDRWRLLLDVNADNRIELRHMYGDVLQALRLGPNTIEDTAAAAILKDPRTADQLAEAYLAARGRRLNR